MQAGEKLKDLRNKLGISLRDVEEYSRQIAETQGNEDFFISNGWLTQIENTDSVPGIHKLFTLSIIYHTSYVELLAIFGVRLEEIARHQQSIPLPRTHLAKTLASDGPGRVTFPIRFDSGCSIERSNLLSRMVEVWGEVPVPL